MRCRQAPTALSVNWRHLLAPEILAAVCQPGHLEGEPLARAALLPLWLFLTCLRGRDLDGAERLREPELEGGPAVVTQD